MKTFVRLIGLFNIKIIYYMKTGMRTGRSSGPVLLRHKKMQDRGPVLQVLGPTGPGPSRTGAVKIKRVRKLRNHKLPYWKIFFFSRFISCDYEPYPHVTSYVITVPPDWDGILIGVNNFKLEKKLFPIGYLSVACKEKKNGNRLLYS
ncbi:hypothetical protein RhiirA1_442147 [Rhizophagus irregularis]|uniref:Uncharacterized protein n=1 Tax=Rhizophagus irregularis TaxID=588596 RepID=A0A2N0RQZ1_9GLOM|nr:hypothetical protein RhiirA1_442147 [Rhizophagus irregularis]